MGFDDLIDCSSFVSAAIGQVGVSAEHASHAIGELSKALNGYSHAEGYDSLSCRQPIRIADIICASIVRKPVLKISEIKGATLTVDSEKIDWNVLEKNFGPLNKGDLIFLS